MSARDDVLAAVRAALAPGGSPGGGGSGSGGGRPAAGSSHSPAGEAAAGSAPPAAPASGTSPTIVDEAVVDGAALLDLFVARVRDYRATVTRCAAVHLAAAVADALEGAASVVVAPGLELDVPGARVDHDLTHTELDHIGAVVTAAAVAIAETGTVVLDHRGDQGRRAITLLPDLHVCVVRESQVVPDVTDAIALLDPARPQTWVSGPSATSDIELSRVEGVHGPRTLHVVLVADGGLGA